MESTLLLLDCIAIVLAVHWYVRNETRKPGEPISGLLRYREILRGAPRPAPKPRARR
ncbi:MAG: hypothetical protein J0H91_17370 [Rhodospirillales bacterium]|nr:hypothetical protein [Rhodospirillales bacterium]